MDPNRQESRSGEFPIPNFICITCGTQFTESEQPPEKCAICEDDRQYVGWSGQQWTTLDNLSQSHRSAVRLQELGLYGIGMEPSFAIGQRALLVTQPGGNVLWDCVPLLNLIPLPAASVRRVVESVELFDYERIYGAWWGKVVSRDAKSAVHRSAERYIRAIAD